MAKPEPVKPEDMPIGGESTGGGAKLGGLKALIMPLALSATVTWMMLSMMAVSPKNYKADMSGLNNTVANGQKANAEQVAGINNTVNNVRSEMANLTKANNDAIANSQRTATDQINALNMRIDGLSTPQAVTDLSANMTRLIAKVDDTSNRLTLLSNQVNLAPVSSLNVYTTSGNITIEANSDRAKAVVYRVIFHPTTAILLSANVTSSDGALVTLAGAVPVRMTAGSALAPQYRLYYESGRWYVSAVEFLTPRTQLVKGWQSRVISYSADDRVWEIAVEELPVTISGGVSVGW